MLAQLPVVGLAGLPDGCSGCGSAGLRPRRWSDRPRRSTRELDWVYFRVMRAMIRSRFCSSVTSLFSVTHVVQHGVGVDDQLVAALLEGDAEHLLVLDGSGRVSGVDGDHVVVALLLAGRISSASGVVARGDDAVGHLVLDQLCGGLHRRRRTGRSSRRRRTCGRHRGHGRRRRPAERARVSGGNVVHLALQRVGQRQAQGCARRGLTCLKEAAAGRPAGLSSAP